VKGNFLRLLRLVDRGVPLPLASVDNRRSLIHVGNLVSAIVACLRLHRAAGNTYLVSDGEDLSTPALVLSLAHALGRKPRLFSFPVGLLEMIARAAGRTGEIARLTRSLEIDSSRMRRELGWQPHYTAAQGLAETARWYHAHPRTAS
jgi:nucleoside-diphosphate-sugar epimerase